MASGRMSLRLALPAVVFLLKLSVTAVDLDVDNPGKLAPGHPIPQLTQVLIDSIRNAAATLAYGLQSMYTGNRTGGVVGKFPYPPFYWWLSGASWGGMLDYWLYTHDDSYYNVTYDALVAQISDTYDYLPVAEKLDEGNDDVAFWALAAMTAAEYGYREPPAPNPSWLGICDNIFNDYVSRWDAANDTCGGGLKWQIFPSSAGYDYKNSCSNGGFFQLAARLARYTNNATYYEWAEKVWDWTTNVGLITDDYNVFDGSDDTINCTGIDHTFWSYNVAIYLYGTAILYNYTDGAEPWGSRTTGLLNFALETFISPYPNATDVLYEQHCELTWDCDVDQHSFKAYLARWMAKTTVMVPDTAETVSLVLRTSAVAAAASCSGEGSDTCGARWYLFAWDGTSGVGQALSALEVVQALLVNEAVPPGTG